MRLLQTVPLGQDSGLASVCLDIVLAACISLGSPRLEVPPVIATKFLKQTNKSL